MPLAWRAEPNRVGGTVKGLKKRTQRQVLLWNQHIRPPLEPKTVGRGWWYTCMSDCVGQLVAHTLTCSRRSSATIGTPGFMVTARPRGHALLKST